ncbi:MAG: hypothetical protein IJ828_06165 [Treponema sp.]|nr:hypothetical protein [Treponema sp.]
MMKCTKKMVAVAFSALALAVVPVFAASEEGSNGSKIKEGASTFFKGVKGSVKDAGTSVSNKAKDITASAYIGTWSFINGKYTTMIVCENDNTMIIVQTQKKGENTWAGTYTVAKKQMTFNIESMNGKKLHDTWVINFDADKKDYMILSSADIPDDLNGYDFSRSTLFLYIEGEPSAVEESERN